MAWSVPRTWVAGELVTASLLNTHIRDNENYLYDYGNNTTIANVPFEFGGTATVPTVGISYPVGATYDKLTTNTGVFSCPAAVPTGTYKLEAVLAVTSGGTVSAALFNLTDAPDTALVTITSTSTTGEKVQSSAVTLVASKVFGVKFKSSAADKQAYAWAIKLVRTA